jgi:hypothetical protein
MPEPRASRHIVLLRLRVCRGATLMIAAGYAALFGHLLINRPSRKMVADQKSVAVRRALHAPSCGAMKR